MGSRASLSCSRPPCRQKGSPTVRALRQAPAEAGGECGCPTLRHMQGTRTVASHGARPVRHAACRRRGEAAKVLLLLPQCARCSLRARHVGQQHCTGRGDVRALAEGLKSRRCSFPRRNFRRTGSAAAAKTAAVLRGDRQLHAECRAELQGTAAPQPMGPGQAAGSRAGACRAGGGGSGVTVRLCWPAEQAAARALPE